MVGSQRLLSFVLLLLLGLGGYGLWSTFDSPGFTAMDPAETGVTFRNDLREDESSNIVDYLYFYNGAGWPRRPQWGRLDGPGFHQQPRRE